MANYNVALGEGVLQAKLNKAIEAGRASAVGVIMLRPPWLALRALRGLLLSRLS